MLEQRYFPIVALFGRIFQQDPFPLYKLQAALREVDLNKSRHTRFSAVPFPGLLLRNLN